MLYHLFHHLTQGQHYAYENPLFRAVLAALFCFLFVLLLSPAITRRLIAWKIGDVPEFDHARLNELTRDKRDVPTMGGAIIVVAILISTLLFADPANFYVLMGLVCLLWLGTVGAVDDWLKISAGRASAQRAQRAQRAEPGGDDAPKAATGRNGLKLYEKLIFQTGLGIVLGYFVYKFGADNYAVAPLRDPMPAYSILSIPFYKAGVELGVLAFMVVTVLVMTATSNAVNLTDGMDGLASGCVAMCSVVFLILAYIVGSQTLAGKLLVPHIPQSGELAILCGGVLGSTLGFLWHNCHPASVFMGDTGSLPLGGLIGYVAIVTRQEVLLLIAGGVFVLEASSVIIQVAFFKASGGKRVFRCAPIHHHFHLAGWSESQTVVRFWLVGAMCAALALASIKLR